MGLLFFLAFCPKCLRLFVHKDILKVVNCY
nr:MAG TPA: optinuerin [Caudoviricetes sp.]